MKTITSVLKNTCSLALVSLALGLAAQAGSLTREVKVVEGTETKSYLGTLFGQTLYTFDYDTGTTSACTKDCVEKWPPLILGADEAKGIAAPYAVLTRTSGLLQLTYNGKPVYTYHLDHTEGDDKGDGVGGVWHDIDFVP